METGKKKGFVLLLMFLLAIILFDFFSKSILFHDTAEYITVAKELSGVHNLKVYTTHSLVYPYLISLFLMIDKSFFVLKLVNSIWLFLIGLLLYKYTKSKKALLIWMLSPLSWMMSIQVSPILPAAFFILLGYIIFIKAEEKKKNVYLLLSGFFFGLSAAIYQPSFLLIIFFIIIFFYNKSFIQFLLFCLSAGIGLLPMMLLDWYYFGLPFYSLIRYFGINALVLAGQSFKISTVKSYLWYLPFIIFPFLFLIYKTDFKKYRRELIFIIISSLFFIIRGEAVKYFLTFSPMILLLIYEKFNKKFLIANTVVSLIIIIIVTNSFFGYNTNAKMIEDLEKIKSEFNKEYIVTAPFEAYNFAALSWTDKPEFIWYWEYENSLNDTKTFSKYIISSKPRIKSDKILVLQFSLENDDIRKFDDDIILIGANPANIPEGFELIRKYNLINAYKLAK
ncbi:MAG TPA: glycosyltransferase family 39 protein [Candidatus Nanoarchaeia archaeon]|nr:glycosyltransferase family 39 protein [Candidatus Nanoarchaeia archaeon]